MLRAEPRAFLAVHPISIQRIPYSCHHGTKRLGSHCGMRVLAKLLRFQAQRLTSGLLLYQSLATASRLLLLVFAKVKEGSVPGRKPFGYYQGEAETIARMEALRASGFGFDRIAARLNADDVPSRSRKCWSGLVVNRILSRRGQHTDGGNAQSARIPLCRYSSGRASSSSTRDSSAIR